MPPSLTKSLLGAFLCVFCTCQAATSQQIDLVAAVLAAEARSEGAHGMSAVAQVIANRGGDPSVTVTRRWQFTCLNRIPPGRLVAKMRGETGWNRASAIAAALYQPGNRAICTMVGKATHFHDTSIRRPPGWGPCLAKVGKLRFYHPK